MFNCRHSMAGRGGLAVALILLLGVLAGDAAAAFDPAQTFEKKCSSCHTIGAGALKGPDLKGVSQRRKMDWIIKFVQNSAALIAAGDADAVKLFNEFKQIDMPEQKLSDDEVKQLMEFIEGGGGGGGSGKKLKSVSSVTSADIEAGQNLYLGLKGLANGGPACISCHSVGSSGPLGGGTLAMDLTTYYSQQPSEAAVDAILMKLQRAVMGPVFEGKQLTEEEAYQIKAFLFDADKVGRVASDPQKKFLFLGLGGTAVVLGMMDFTWRRRRKSSVRREHGGIR